MEQTVIRAKNGDSAALDEILSSYKGMVRSIANKYYLVGGDKDDLLQEGMIALFFAVEKFDETKGTFPSFAKLCVERHICDAVRRGNNKNRLIADGLVDITNDNLCDDADNPLADILEKEHSQKISHIIATQLTPLERRVTYLFAEGYSYKDISEQLQKSYKAVDGALQRARKKLLSFKE